MSKQLWWATLNRTSPRYETWLGILGRDTDVPLTSPGSGHTDLGPEKDVEVYLLDIASLDETQRARLVQWIHGRFGDPIDEVNREIDRVGFPIRAADVFVTFDLRAFI